ncbi:MAG: insulinase family protein [Acidiferrobacterales bacterium]|nr:insulinase family protein [Acidiferrobacterales bacterium]
MLTANPHLSRFVLLFTALSLSHPVVSDDSAQKTEKFTPVMPITSETDDNAYRGLVLENGLKVMLISDPDTDQAAAALDVHVGSGSDPDGWNGLAHFLEHMLFLGNGKYPEAGEYQKFIQSRGGSNNAYTAYDHTNYFFGVNHDSLLPALDRFSRFFIDPTFEETYVERERAVVHSEYQARLKDEGRRVWAAQKQVLNPGHPASRFSVGSLETLADRSGMSVRDKLIAFYEKWYSADIMALTVVGRENLDQLETWVRERFSEVPGRGVQPPIYVQSYLNKELLPGRIDIVPLKETYSVAFQFSIPSTMDEFRSKPVSYLANLLGHEGEGSLLAALKALGWADSLSAGSGFMDRAQGTLQISIGLTEPGAAHIDQIGEMLFHHIAKLKREGIEKWRFEEEQKLGQIAFRFAEKSSASNLARSIASRLHDYPMEEVLSGPYLMEEYQPQRLSELLDYLTPKKVMVQVVSPKHKARNVSPYYGVRYVVNPISDDIIERWVNAENAKFPQLAMPAPNPFIPERLELQSDLSASTKPVTVPREDGVELWYRPDQEFRTPRSSFYFSIKSAQANSTARDAVLTELAVRMLNDQLNIETYPARLAGLRYSLYRHSRGISVRLGGYQDGQKALLNVILKALKSPDIESEKLTLIKDELGRELANSKKERPSSQTVHEIYRLLLTPYWTEDERLAELDSITAKEVKQHLQGLMEQVQLTVLGHGDISEQQTSDMASLIANFLGDALVRKDVPRNRLRRLEEGKAYLRTMDIEHNDTAVSYYYQDTEKSIDARAKTTLLGQLLEAPFYFDLRTTNRVGYLVYATNINITEVPGLLLSIQSPSHSAQDLDQLIAKFLDGFPQQLASMSDDAFDQTKRGLIARILKKDNQLSQRTDRYWTQIDLKEYGFDTRERLAGAIRSLTKADMLETFEQIFAEQKRLLLVQASGRRDGASEQEVSGSVWTKTQVPTVFRKSATRFFPAL